MGLTTILVQVKDDKFRYELSLQFDYAHPDCLIRAINDAIPVLLKEGTMTPLLNHIKDINVSGIPIQRVDKVEERNDRYIKTGN